jgi:hypothetical protein
MLSQKDAELDKAKGRSITPGLLSDSVGAVTFHQSLSKTDIGSSPLKQVSGG